MEYKLKVIKFKDPTKGNWDVNITGGYENIVGKAFGTKQYKEPDTVKTGETNLGTQTNNGYWSISGELTGLITPFTNPVTNAAVTLPKIEATFEDPHGWETQTPGDQYFGYLASSVAEVLQAKYKQEFGVEITLKTEAIPEKKTETPPDPKPKDEKPSASPGVVAKYVSTGASNNGVPMEITYEMFKDGISVYKSKMTTGFKYDEKTKLITISAAETFYDASGKWVETNGKDQFATKDQIFTLEGYPPVPDAGTSGTSGTAGTSGASGPKIYGEFTLDVRQQDVMFSKEFGALEIIMKGVMKQEKVEDVAENTEEALAEQEPDEYAEEPFEGQDELIVVADFKMNLPPLEDPNPTPESTARVDETKIDYNDPSFVGDKWKSFDIDKLISNVDKRYGPSGAFKESLKKVLYFIKKDASINDVRKAAYMLGTAFAESGYSLQRWEADYACGSTGVKYGSGGPCSSATNYYRSTKGGKANYYNLGTDTKGFPYFGRGLIQLTGKANYASYGKKIGVDLVGNGDLAMDPQNSYKIAAEFLKANTFSKVISGDLTRARRSVNGGTKGIAEVNGAYNAWLEAFKKVGSAA